MGRSLPLRMYSEEVRPNVPATFLRNGAGGKDWDTWLSFHAPSDFPQERRSTTRFPLELPAEISLGPSRIAGRTANISSGGMLLVCEDDVELGSLVTVRVHWPVQQRDRQVALVLHGEIIRREPSRIAILHRRHEFEVSTTVSATETCPSLFQRLVSLITPSFSFPQLQLAD